MIELISQFIVPITIVASVAGSVGIVTFIIVLRDKISGVYVSRSSLEIRTNDVPVWKQIAQKIERITTSIPTWSRFIGYFAIQKRTRNS